MTTTPQITRALADELKAALKDETIQFPYECSDDALAFIVANSEGYNWMKMRAGQEQTIRQHGRTLVSIPQEDANGELIRHNKTGKVMLDFLYTLGQGRKGLPELLCFYPSSTIGFAINKLCDKMEEGTIHPSPTGSTRVSGCFEDESLDLVLYPITGKARELAAEKYACQCEDDEPLFLVFAPLPNGQFRPEFIPNEFIPNEFIAAFS